MDAVRFVDPESGLVHGAFLVDGKVNVRSLKRYFGALEVSVNIDNTFYILLEDNAGWSTNKFRAGELLEIHYTKATPPAAAEGAAGLTLLDQVTVEYFSRYPHYFVPSASGLAKGYKERKSDEETYLKKHQVEGKELFLNYRPDTACGPPVALLCPIFGKFLDACNKSQVSHRSCEFVWELCEKSSRFYKDESDRMKMVLELLQSYLPAGFSFQVAKPGEAIRILYCGIVVGILEGKIEAGTSGDSQVQISKYYYDECYMAAQAGSPVFLGTCFPMLLVEVVGPMIRVSGAVFDGAPIIEPLTPMLPLFRMRRRDYMDQLVRVVQAIPAALNELAETHLKASNLPAKKRDHEYLSLPCPLQRWYSEGARFGAPETGPTLARRPSSRREAYIYVADLTRWHGENAGLSAAVSGGFRKVFVKICESYSSEVHKAWSEQGCAPKWFGEEHFPGGWSVVVMEYMEGWKTLFQVGQWAQPELWRAISDKARSCLQRAQSAPLRGVHADLRLPNVLVSPDLSQVCFVDFGWAGVEDQSRYPNYMNHGHILWPEGAAEGNYLKQQHDVDLLKTELGNNRKAEDGKNCGKSEELTYGVAAAAGSLATESASSSSHSSEEEAASSGIAKSSKRSGSHLCDIGKRNSPRVS